MALALGVGIGVPFGGLVVSNAVLLLSTAGPYGAVMDYTDASIATADSTGALNYQSKGDVSNGLLIGPAAKLTYAAPSPKMLEQADGFQRYGAHNIYLNNGAPANQSVTVLSGATYKIRVTGTVSITLSGAATGTVTTGNPISFTASTALLTCGSTSGAGKVYLYRTPCNEDDVDTAGTAIYALPYRWSGGVRKGIENEPQSTNLAYPSSTFASGFGASNLIVAAASVALSNGLTGGGTLTDTIGNAVHFSYPLSLAGGLTTVTDHAISVSVKAGTARYLVLSLQGAAGNFASAVFDTLNASAISASQTGVGATSGTVQSTKQENRADGWVTCTLVAQCTGSSTPCFGLAPAATGNTFATSGFVVYAGTPSTMYIEHVQVEVGLASTSRITTYGAAVVRAADTIGGLISAIPFNASEFTLFIEGTFKSNPGNYPAMLQLRDAGSGNRAELFINPGGILKQYAMLSTITQLDMLSGFNPTLGTPFRAAARFKASDFAISPNGAAPAKQASGSMPTGLTDFALYGAGRAPMSIRRLGIFPRGFADGELQAIGA